MSPGHWIGTVGVTILLLAFGLLIAKKITAESGSYLMMNFAGSVLAGISSYLVAFWPFVILEGVWAIASLLAFFKIIKT